MAFFAKLDGLHSRKTAESWADDAEFGYRRRLPHNSSVKDIRRRTRKKYSAEEKIRIVLDGLRGEESIAALCRKEGIPTNLYYRWGKDFLEAGKKRLMGDTVREASSSEVSELRKENEELKQFFAEVALKNRVLKKSLTGWDTGEAGI